jgi:RNA polymerase sigma-70 factor (ECF subfamily)
MTRISPNAVTDLIEQARTGDSLALDRLLPLVYGELRHIAARYMARERPGQTLQATALVHEAYLRLARDSNLSFQNRAHLLGIAARAMREILVERARARGALKRGGKDARVTLDEGILGGGVSGQVDVLAVHEALDRLAAVDSRHARIVELRYFGGLTVEETAEVMAVSPATVKRGWALARAWLFREVAGQ